MMLCVIVSAEKLEIAEDVQETRIWVSLGC